MACDICGKTDSGVRLVDLLKEYTTDDIKQMCLSCEKEVNDHLWKLRLMTAKMNQTWLKRFMEAMKERFTKSTIERR